MDCLQIFKELSELGKDTCTNKFNALAKDLQATFRCMLFENLNFVEDVQHSNASVCTLSSATNLVFYYPDNLVMYHHGKKVVDLSYMYGIMRYQTFLDGRITSDKAKAILPRIKRHFGDDFELVKVQARTYVANGVSFFPFYCLLDFSSNDFPITLHNTVFLDHTHFVMLDGDTKC